jgi:hypothetical protein
LARFLTLRCTKEARYSVPVHPDGEAGAPGAGRLNLRVACEGGEFLGAGTCGDGVTVSGSATEVYEEQCDGWTPGSLV